MYNNQENPGVTDETIQEALLGILNGEWDMEYSALESAEARTFEDAGVMTYNKGLVITLPDGTEYQLNIVRSR